MPRHDEDDPGPERCYCKGPGRPRYVYVCKRCARRVLAEVAERAKALEEEQRQRALRWGAEE